MGTAQGGVSAAGAGSDPERFAGRDRLPGTGDAHRQRAGELFAWRSRPAAAGDGEERSEGDGRAARSLYDRRGQTWSSEGRGGRDLRADGEVLRIRLQQVSLRGLRAGGLPDGVSEDALSGRIYGGAAHFRNV